MRERLFGRRVDHVLALAAVAVEPLAVDVEFEFAVHGVLSAVRFLLAMGLACDNDLVPAVHAAMVGPCRSRNHDRRPCTRPRSATTGRAREVRALFALPFPGADVPRAERPPRAFRSDRGADLDAAVDQDRRLPGGLRLLPAERALRHRRQGREADGARRRARRGARGQGRAAPAASAWARPGASRRTAISTRSAPWSRASRRSGSRPARRSACSTAEQAQRLKAAGLDYYNHNLDTSPEFYGEIITTRTYQDRLDTLGAVRDAGIHVCCGGIVGMGESARAIASA